MVRQAWYGKVWRRKAGRGRRGTARHVARIRHTKGWRTLRAALVINLKTAGATLFSLEIPTPRVSLDFKENEPLAER
jgi:hypothetical protein